MTLADITPKDPQVTYVYFFESGIEAFRSQMTPSQIAAMPQRMGQVRAADEIEILGSSYINQTFFGGDELLIEADIRYFLWLALGYRLQWRCDEMQGKLAGIRG
jgi:hypothetical protein